MKKRKLNIKNIVILFVILVVIFIFISPFIFINIKLIGNKKVIVNYGDEYSESGYRATIFNKNITKDIKVTNNIKSDLGSYEVRYSYKFLFYNIKRTRTVIVKDTEKPKIELIGDATYEQTINEEYIEPGCKVIDNYDGDITSKVSISGNVNIKELGEYKVSYEVTDSNGNKSTSTRLVKVVKKKPTQMSLTEYSLSGWYEENLVSKTKDYGNDYYNGITMIGDSNVMYGYYSGYIKGVNAWALPCLTASTMHHLKLDLYGYGISMRLIEAITKYKPKMVMLNFGQFSTSLIDTEEDFINKANDIIRKIKEASPDTKIVLTSIYPVTKVRPSENEFSQTKINKYNFIILEIANKNNLKYLDIQEALKDSTGYANPNYYETDGWHLNNTGHSVVKEYIKTHGIE